MRTNIVIDDSLMNEVLKATGLQTKREAVELGLKTSIRLKKQEGIKGFRSDSDFHRAKELMMSLTIFNMLGVENAIKSAENFRALRKRGITIRKTADVIIGTYCAAERHALLFSDQNFIPFVEHLGLRAVSCSA